MQKDNNRSLLILPVAAFILFSVLYSCSEDPTGTGGNTITSPGYDEVESGINMTLAALCYTAEDNANVIQIRDSLILQLSDTTYTTKGRWKLAWGPGISQSRANMFYVAVDTTSDTIYYCIAVRGTDFSFPENIKEDMEVWDQVKYPFGSGTGDSVAEGSLKGLDTLLAATDPVSGHTLQSFLTGIPAGALKMFITGHSLGGALATMISSWFIDMGYTSKFRLETYTFASPTVGNPAFADRYNSLLASVNAHSHRVVNTKDVVPYLWAGLDRIVPENIPTSVPFYIFNLITGIQIYLQQEGVVYKHVDTKVPIGYLTPTNCNTGSSTDIYFCWVAFEHNTNNYLRLLHADTVKF